MASEAVIALDQGSGSSRALAFDSRGRAIARAQFPLRTFYPKPGWVEHDAEEIVRTQERALDAVLASLPRSTRVLGVGMASQRSTVILWDGKTGKPLCRALSWQDGRAAGLLQSLAIDPASIPEKTGLYLTPYYSAPKILWLADQIPKVRAARDKGRLRIAPVGSYCLWRLTRGGVWTVDPSLAQRTLLLNIRTMDWDQDLLARFGASRDFLPPLAASTGSFGFITRSGRKMPVLALLGDQQSAALGLGGEEPGAGILNYGTGAFFLLNTGTQQHRVPGLLTSVAWKRGGRPCQYLEEGTVHAAGASFEWLRQNFGLLDRLDRLDSMCRRSKNRILALQAIGGLGAPRWDYSTFTSYMGFNSASRPEDLVRGIAEGIAFLLADVVSAARSAGLEIRSVQASGGLSKADYLLQFQADLIQRDVLRVAESEATALGVASLAAQEAGAPWARSLRGRGGGRRFKPSMPPERAERLMSGWRLFVEAQQKVSAALRKLDVLP